MDTVHSTVDGPVDGNRCRAEDTSQQLHYLAAGEHRRPFDSQVGGTCAQPRRRPHACSHASFSTPSRHYLCVQTHKSTKKQHRRPRPTTPTQANITFLPLTLFFLFFNSFLFSADTKLVKAAYDFVSHAKSNLHTRDYHVHHTCMLRLCGWVCTAYTCDYAVSTDLMPVAEYVVRT